MTERPPVDVSIVLACYNEEACVDEEIERITRAMNASDYSWEFLIIDDCSTDRTAEMVAQHEHVHLIRHPVNIGSGGARRTGTEASAGEIVVWTDADMTYPNEQIPDLVTFLRDKGYAQVVGARKAEAGTLKALRVPAKWFIRRLASFLAGRPIPDLNSGLRAFRRDVAQHYLHLLPPGFSCVSTITLSFLCNHHPVGYFPIDYSRRVGVSKFHPIKDAFRYGLQVIRMITLFNPLKIFLPTAALLLLIALGSGAHNFYWTQSLQELDVILALGAILIGMLGLLADLIVAQGKR